MTENMTVKNQPTVNFNADVIIWLKGVSSLHLQVSFSNIYATGG
jgi:hypothetical protein